MLAQNDTPAAAGSKSSPTAPEADRERPDSRTATEADPQRPESSSLIADVEQELSVLLRRSRSASMQLARRVHPEMDAAGYALISQIEQGTSAGGPGVRASDVAQALGLDKSTVSRGLTQLESLGLIERVGDPDDGRARLLRLTDSGAASFGAMRTQRRAQFRAILNRWDPPDLADLARLLSRLNSDLG